MPSTIEYQEWLDSREEQYNIVRIEEQNSLEYGSNLLISDTCLEFGKNYLYISNLDCSQFVSDYYSRDCKNYATISHSRKIALYECDETMLTPVTLSEDEIEKMKSDMHYEEATLAIEEESLDFGDVVIGQTSEKEIIVQNLSETFLLSPPNYRWYIYSDNEDSALLSYSGEDVLLSGRGVVAEEQDDDNSFDDSENTTTSSSGCTLLTVSR